LSASELKLKYTCSAVVAPFATGANAVVSANAPTAATKSEYFRNLIMLFPPVNCYCANSSGGTVLSVVFGMARLFLKFSSPSSGPRFRDPFYQLSLAWQDFF
jgi:hypothetical protein